MILAHGAMPMLIETNAIAMIKKATSKSPRCRLKHASQGEEMVHIPGGDELQRPIVFIRRQTSTATDAEATTNLIHELAHGLVSVFTECFALPTTATWMHQPSHRGELSA